MEFNKNHYFKLLREMKQLKHNIDKTKQKEVLQYEILLMDDIGWKNRYEYLQIVKLFVQKLITMDEFQDQFSKLYDFNCSIVQIYRKNLKTEAFSNFCIEKKDEIKLSIDSRSIGFMKTISIIFHHLEEYLEYSDSITPDMDEESLRNYIKEICLPKIASYCNEF